MRSQLNVDSGQMVKRCDDIEKRLDKFENKFHYDPEVTIVAQYLPDLPGRGDNIQDLAVTLVRDGLNVVDIPVVRAKRLVSRNNNPGLVKIEFKSLDDKKKILIEKKKLRQTDHFRNTYIYSSQSHMERLQEINTHILLQEIPNGNKYCITANGHLVPNDYGQERERRDFGLGPGLIGPHGQPQQQW